MDFNTFIARNCREGLKSLPEESIDVVVTSPPYYGLRNYGFEAVTIWSGDSKCKHEWKKNGVKVDNLRYRAGHNSTVGNHKNKKYIQLMKLKRLPVFAVGLGKAN